MATIARIKLKPRQATRVPKNAEKACMQWPSQHEEACDNNAQCHGLLPRVVSLNKSDTTTVVRNLAINKSKSGFSPVKTYLCIRSIFKIELLEHFNTIE
jgi:hypothetical protein